MLLQLEKESWIEDMRHSSELLLQRINAYPPKVFVLEVAGQLVGSICTQCIDSVEDIFSVTWRTEDSIANQESGTVLQLLRVNTFLESAPSVAQGIAVGAILRDFCLEYARLLGFLHVCAVTKTTDYCASSEQSYSAFVSALDVRHTHADRGLNFHVSRGAHVVKAMEGWRPEDPANLGFGVLIAYDLAEVRSV